ncbi:MAG TPA: hypothetical protein VGF71_02260 [Caulobacteraceae bacterium]|jgi:hypothetical protein
MNRPDPIRYDNFARSLATGVAIRTAAKAAGYATRSSRYSKIAKRPEFLELVARYRQELRQAGKLGLEPVIAELMERAQKAMDHGSAEHIAVAAWLLGQAGRAKPRLGARRFTYGRLSRGRAIEKAFFDCWGDRNVLSPFEIPAAWFRIRSIDWGTAAPFSVGWWAEAGEDFLTADGLIHRGALIRYREWYGRGADGKGLALDVEEVAAGILERERAAGDVVGLSVADRSMFSRNGGKTLAARLADVGVPCQMAKNTRVGKPGKMDGWEAVSGRICGDGERPMLYVLDTCRDFIRTVPTLPRDPERPGDLNTKTEDHIADETRYACLARPLGAGAGAADGR